MGAILDEKLTFKDHVEKNCQKAMLNFIRIKSIRKYLTTKATKILVSSLIISHLDFCNGLLYDIEEKEINKMQRIMNMCAKLILNPKKCENTRHALKDLRWLPVKARIKIKILSYMYICNTNAAPTYLTELLSPKKQTGPVLRSSETSELCYNVPFNKRKTFSNRSFSTAGPTLWNSLPLNVKQSGSLDEFKAKLELYFFENFDACF